MLKIMLSAAVALVLCGCVFFQNSYVEPAEFDLLNSVPASSNPAALPVHFGVFRNLSGADRRFLVRRSDGTISRDEYRRWLMEPELMLERCFNEQLSPAAGNDAAEAVTVSGVIYRFEFMLEPPQARFEARFKLRYKSQIREVSVDITRDITEEQPAGLAMAACVEAAADRLRQEIDSLKGVSE